MSAKFPRGGEGPFLVRSLYLLFFMPINQKSLLMIHVPNSAITVSQTLIPSKPHFQKAVGGFKKFFCGHSSKTKVTST